MSAVGTEGLNPKMLTEKSFVCQDWVRSLYSTHRRNKYHPWELRSPLSPMTLPRTTPLPP